MFSCAVASSGCGNGSSSTTTSTFNKDVIGSYMVMITNTDVMRTDSDVMTVSAGSDGDILLTFVAGITTDISGPNPDGLRGLLKATDVTVAAQPAHVDHSTGNLDGSISGTGTFTSGTMSTCDLKMSFVPDGGTAMSFEITGSHL
jgi:hypothetical protein